MMPEDLNTVHELTQKIEKMRAGAEFDTTEGAQLTPGQLWGRLLDLEPEDRIEMLHRLTRSANEGAACAMAMHNAELAAQGDLLNKLAQSKREWNTAHRLITMFIATLRRDQKSWAKKGSVADKLELFLAGGRNSESQNHARRILCGHRWSEAGREFECAEPVGSDGLHQGEHYAYVREGAAADEELRMRYLEDENDELRGRLGLPLNKRTT